MALLMLYVGVRKRAPYGSRRRAGWRFPVPLSAVREVSWPLPVESDSPDASVVFVGMPNAAASPCMHL